jgi:DNA-binding beta-propeller fold protein YncE
MLKQLLTTMGAVLVGTGAMIFAAHHADRDAGFKEVISAAASIEAADATTQDGASTTALPDGHRFHHFESGHVRPLAMSANRQYVFAVNTPDNRLEVLRADRNRLTPVASVPVGLEPVAIAVNGNEAWVVNQLSDSVSVVDVTQPMMPFVKETILVGDEPRDVVFAGTTRKKAFITTARRGQNSTVDPKLTTPGAGRALVWVFDAATAVGTGISRLSLTVVELFTDTPRALAVSSDKKRVYAAGFQTGNKTTTATALVFPFFLPPPPFTNAQGRQQPFGGLIVKHDGQHWRDELGRDFDYAVYADLPDHDVFVIDAEAQVPAQLPGAQGVYSGVGTVIYGMTVNPVSGALYVMNTEALNEQRFEGPGEFAGHSIRGRHNLNRISVLRNGQVATRHLNKHVDFSDCCATAPNAESVLSVALPMLGDSSRDGSKLYVPFMGSSKVAVYNTAALEADTFMPRREDQITLGGGGPTGLVLDENRRQLYVMTRFDNAVRVVDLGTQRETGTVKLFNPEPLPIVKGRRHLYDATRSAKGDSSCASCHTFGDQDSLAWDLGNPDASDAENANPFNVSTFNVLGTPPDPMFSSMKGPWSRRACVAWPTMGPCTGGGIAPGPARRRACSRTAARSMSGRRSASSRAASPNCWGSRTDCRPPRSKNSPISFCRSAIRPIPSAISITA